MARGALSIWVKKRGTQARAANVGTVKNVSAFFLVASNHFNNIRAVRLGSKQHRAKLLLLPTRRERSDVTTARASLSGGTDCARTGVQRR